MICQGRCRTGNTCSRLEHTGECECAQPDCDHCHHRPSNKTSLNQFRRSGSVKILLNGARAGEIYVKEGDTLKLVVGNNDNADALFETVFSDD